jgi:hypothetical protein
VLGLSGLAFSPLVARTSDSALKGAQINQLNAQAFGATGSGTTDDTAALQAWINAACATHGTSAFLPIPPRCYKTTSQLTFCPGVRWIGAGWNISDGGYAHGTVTDPTTYIRGSLICPQQTSGVAAMIVSSSLFAPSGGDMEQIAFAGLGTNGATIKISSISDSNNGNVGSTVTIGLARPHGIKIGHETGLIVSGVRPVYTIIGCTSSTTRATCTTTAAHGMTLPMQNVTVTVSGVSIAGYNATGLTPTAVGPCTSCGHGGGSLLDTQFQYTTSGGGLSAGTGGKITQKGNVAGGLTYSKPVMATATTESALTYYLPFTGLGSMSSTGTATLTPIGLLIGDVAQQVGPGGGYLSQFNTDHVAVLNFGLGVGFLEQDAHHRGMNFDRENVAMFDEMLFNTENDALVFDSFLFGATKAAQYNIDWSGYSVNNIFQNMVLETPNHDDSTAANMIVSDALSPIILNAYNTPRDGLPGGQHFTGEGLDILGAYSAEETKIIGGFYDAGPNSSADIHLYSGSLAHIEDIRAFNALIIEQPATYTRLFNNNLGSIADKTAGQRQGTLIESFGTFPSGIAFGPGIVPNQLLDNETVDIQQIANGGNGIDLRRATDSSPKGIAIKVVNKANSATQFSTDWSGNLAATSMTGTVAARISGGGKLATGSNSFAGRITELAATGNVLMPGFTCPNAVTATFQDNTTAGGVQVTAQSATSVTFSATASDTVDYLTGCR